MKLQNITDRWRFYTKHYLQGTHKHANEIFLTFFNVFFQGFKYRFRVINAEFLNCPIEMSVDGHNITVIASDGYDLEPITGK